MAHPIAFAVQLLTITLALFQRTLAVEPYHQLVESLSEIPHGWYKGERAPPSALIKFHLAIKRPTKHFEQAVINISTPDHPNYGRHMRRDELKDILRSDPAALNDVLSWLKSENLDPNTVEVDGIWIRFEVSVAQAERMLKTEFSYFHDASKLNTAIRTLNYSVPQRIHHNIALIQPTTKFAALNQGGDNPQCLRDLYNINATKARRDKRNRLGISGFLEQFARHNDFQFFMNSLSPNEAGANFSVVRINGGLNDEDSSSGSTEASLDVQYSMALSYNALGTFYTTGGRGPLIPDGDQPDPNKTTNEPYLEQLHYLINLPDDELPAVLTTSYGEPEQTVPASYAAAVCNLYAQLGARGVSVIFSSGDSGVGRSCQSNDGSYRTRFLPGFPAACPFVTSVGGTYSHRPERAVDFSGGGFSDIFPRPSYQDEAVKGYLDQLGDQWSGLYNPKGRGIPDVSAQASGFLIRDHGRFMRISGTSASAPVFAGIVSQLNSIRLAQGKPRMGFLNPWLYSTGVSGMTDIVDGGSRGCYGGERGIAVPYASWNATAGWDPVTGLGTPVANNEEVDISHNQWGGRGLNCCEAPVLAIYGGKLTNYKTRQ
ncbi:polynucleotide 3'-phosphatase [Penicillium argentinense]|uniref:tripeptidyl-peptidase II n=1 Tax=Penicillium argentinense TaxID=1131581 RepID=A0A9W9G3B2_9EURO|nr:polynucleotide 3'-phosphatase [Penicillium argentinense]KAJ5111267.1 polynucleotide 3'-phosphatase [Penicillium argentinense]